ncbi:MAG: SDR family oxidoreductase [Planctomycetaceae bacterium]
MCNTVNLMGSKSRILITGGTGYVGGRLISRFEEQGTAVRCMARRPENMQFRVDPATEVVDGDVLRPSSLVDRLDGIETAYYLVHSMGTRRDFETEDRDGARNFALAARAAGVKRIIYLGGLGDSAQELSAHLRSRQEVGQLLSLSGAQVIEFRASIIIGSGSLSFELIRALVQRLPFMICPRWVRTPATPIAIEDVLAYLVAALDFDEPGHHIFEIGGPEQVTYHELMQEYARQRGLKRLMISVPFLTPRLSSLWLGLVTPVYARVGRKLVDSLRHPTVVRDTAAETVFSVKPRGVAAAINRALVREDCDFAETVWSNALSSSGRPRRWGGEKFGNRLVDSRTMAVDLSSEELFVPIRKIGGLSGWYYANWLWQIRGFLDLLAGGVGIRRGRRDAEHLAVGEIVDCWRVEAIEPGRLLRLSSEMKLPGRAWLEFEVTRDGTSRSTIRQTAVFDPLGLAGLAYWYSIYPLHEFLFAGMLRGISKAALNSKSSA